MSSSRRSGSVSWNSSRHSALVRETCCAGRAGLPDAQEPDPVEAHLGQTVQFGVRNIVQRGGAAQLCDEFGQPDARVDLVQRRIARSRSYSLAACCLLAADCSLTSPRPAAPVPRLEATSCAVMRPNRCRSGR